MALAITNKSDFTDRSVRTLVLWARKKVATRLTPKQRARLYAVRAASTLPLSSAPGDTTINAHRVLQYWAFQAGLTSFGHTAASIISEISDLTEIPLLVRYADPKAKPAPPPKSLKETTIDRIKRKIELKTKHLEKLSSQRKTVERRWIAAQSALDNLQKNLRRAETRLAAVHTAPAAHLNTDDYATRMRLRREQQEDPSSAAR